MFFTFRSTKLFFCRQYLINLSFLLFALLISFHSSYFVDTYFSLLSSLLQSLPFYLSFYFGWFSNVLLHLLFSQATFNLFWMFILNSLRNYNHNTRSLRILRWSNNARRHAGRRRHMCPVSQNGELIRSTVSNMRLRGGVTYYSFLNFLRTKFVLLIRLLKLFFHKQYLINLDYFACLLIVLFGYCIFYIFESLDI